MFNSAVLDVAIGVIFVYLLLALICTVVNEWLASWRRWRPHMLEEALRTLLGHRTKDLLGHPLIAGLTAPEETQRIRGWLGKNQTTWPSYIEPRIFARTLLDLNKEKTAGKGEAESADARILEALRADADARKQSVEKSIEEWYTSAMDRVTGRYKRKLQGWTLGVALVVTVIANADTFDIARHLWQDPALRAAVVAEAQVRAQKEPPLNVEYPDPDSPEPSDPVITPPQPDEAYQLSAKERELLGDLVGWSAERKDWAERKKKCGAEDINCIVTKRFEWARWWGTEHGPGWLLTALAVSLGAPFWFDVLNKAINLRNAGRKPEKKKEGQA